MIVVRVQAIRTMVSDHFKRTLSPYVERRHGVTKQVDVLRGGQGLDARIAGPALAGKPSGDHAGR